MEHDFQRTPDPGPDPHFNPATDDAEEQDDALNPPFPDDDIHPEYNPATRELEVDDEEDASDND